MKIITLYNHKGGVSKTTSTFNLATFLADQGKKVLIVDADPQCNLTEIALVNVIREYDEQEEKENTKEARELPGTSILEALNQRISGDAPYIDLDKVVTVKLSRNFHLLRGSVNLSSVEDDLAESHVQRMSRRTNLMRTYVAVGDFLVRMAEKEKFDYIFVDVGPSSGALTRAFFLACDAFFLPVAPDRFNVQAIGTLSSIIDRWMGEHGLVYEQYKELELPIRRGQPAFLGAIVQAFKMYAKKPKPGYKLWMSRIPTTINESLKPVMGKYSKDNTLFLPEGKNPIVVEIPDFNQLAPLMQEVGKAVFNIKQEDTQRITDSGQPWVGNNWSQAKERMEDYKKRYGLMAKVVEDFDQKFAFG